MTRRSWWRSNRLALAAMTVLVPGAVLVFGFEGISSAWSDMTTSAAPIVAEGESVTVGDYRVGPARASIATQVEGAAPDSKVVVVTIEAERLSDDPWAESCTIGELNSTADDRQWHQAPNIRVPWDTSAFQYSCTNLTPDSHFSIRVMYMVPRDVTGPFTLDVANLAQSSVDRFEVSIP